MVCTSCLQLCRKDGYWNPLESRKAGSDRHPRFKPIYRKFPSRTLIIFLSFWSQFSCRCGFLLLIHHSLTSLLLELLTSVTNIATVGAIVFRSINRRDFIKYLRLLRTCTSCSCAPTHGTPACSSRPGQEVEGLQRCFGQSSDGVMRVLKLKTVKYYRFGT